MQTLVGILVSVIFFLLSGLHVYWACGGKFGKLVAIPESGGKPLFQPSGPATLGVALGLALAGFTVLGRIGWVATSAPSEMFSVGCWILTTLFFVRAVGDFKWVGFFKRYRGTPFSIWDDRLFSPLCVTLSVSIAVINW